MKTNKGIAIGIALGTLVGFLTSNIALWLPVGVAIGAGYSLSIEKSE